MRNRTGIILLSVIVSLLCGYYLSLSWITKGIERKASRYARDASGVLDYRLKQRYLDSVWNEPVLRVLGLSFTYRELKETELNLGLDLRGGMHLTLEVSAEEVVRALARRPLDSGLVRVLSAATAQSRRTSSPYASALYDQWQRYEGDRPLRSVFLHLGTRNRLSANANDAEVLDLIARELEQSIERSFYILRSRIDRFGTSQPNIHRLQGSHHIQIELPGIDNPARVRKILQGVAHLSFWEVHTPDQVVPVLESINSLLVSLDTSTYGSGDSEESLADLASLLQEEDESLTADLADDLDADTLDDETLDSESLADELDSRASPLYRLLRSNEVLLYEEQDTSEINRLFARADVQTLLPPDMRFLWSAQPYESDGVKLLELHPIRATRFQKAPLSGEVISDARQEFDTYGRPSIGMQMSPRGAKQWRNMTRKNLNKKIAIVLDERVYSAPVVEAEIANGNSQITGSFTIEEAQDLANILKSGALPARTIIIEDLVVGPTLGLQAQQQGLTSIVVGLLLVLLFMIIYYAQGGWIANLALTLNIFFILGILTQLNASLTLPGIAGIVLTIGMSIDANVLIFERIREELKKGTGLKAAVRQGYTRAFASIIDANVTTFLAGVILYGLGQGPVKGFAITLMVGIICSFFTAVFITRLVVERLLARRQGQGQFKLETAWARPLAADRNLNFMSNRRRYYIGSALFIALGLLALMAKGGLKLGVDFLGGRAYTVRFAQAPIPSALQEGLPNYLGGQDVEVKTFGADNLLKITTSYRVNEDGENIDEEVKNQLIKGLQALTQLKHDPNTANTNTDTFVIDSSLKIGATIAKDIKEASIRALITALIILFLYIMIRFRHWQFGVGALVALLHDSLIVLSAFAIGHLIGFPLDVDQVFIAALLTLIGYSINDTVVVFDRVRERMKDKHASSYLNTFNLALNQTIARTLITSATTLFVVLVLLLFGGAALRGFSFALLIGIITGTYSSLCIATPVALDLMKKKKKTIAVSSSD